jgi:hypothetical protein
MCEVGHTFTCPVVHELEVLQVEDEHGVAGSTPWVHFLNIGLLQGSKSRYQGSKTLK